MVILDDEASFAEIMELDEIEGGLLISNFSNFTNVSTSTADSRSPLDTYSESKRHYTIIAYIVLFAVAFSGNLSIFVMMLTGRRRQTRINYLIMHLAFADTLVSLFNMPLEIAWRLTVQWRGGTFVCKFFQYCRVFSLFLSSFIIIVVSLDRYFAIMHPIRRFAARSWSNKMLVAAWVAAAICAIPQAYVFRIMKHPVHRSFEQCGTFDLPGLAVYIVYTIVLMYVLPLMVIVFCYARILTRISSRRRMDQTVEAHFSRNLQQQGTPDGQVMLRCSTGATLLQRAKVRALRMTILIVGFFVVFWTPYCVMTFWWVMDEKSAEYAVQESFQDILYMFAMFNACVNPVVYGSFTMDMRKLCHRCCPQNPRDILGTDLTPQQSRSAPSGVSRAEAAARMTINRWTGRHLPRRNTSVPDAPVVQPNKGECPTACTAVSPRHHRLSFQADGEEICQQPVDNAAEAFLQGNNCG